MRKTIVTLTGPSCAGKTTLEGLLKAEGLMNLISTTTRAPREGEKDGVNYYYRDKSTFARLVAQGAFIENVIFGGHRYGITGSEVTRAFAAGKDVVLVCEPEGMRQIAHWAKKNGTPHIAVYVDNPPHVIAERFMKRAGIDIAEAMIHKDPQAAAAVTTGYSKRLAEMMTTERSWINLIRDAEIDVYLPAFNADNQEACVRQVLNRLDGKVIALQRGAAA